MSEEHTGHVTKRERELTRVRRQPKHYGKRGSKAHNPRKAYNRHDRSWEVEQS